MWAPTSVRICTLSPSYARSIGVYGSVGPTPNCTGGKLKQSVPGHNGLILPVGCTFIAGSIRVIERKTCERSVCSGDVCVPCSGLTRNGGGSLR